MLQRLSHLSKDSQTGPARICLVGVGSDLRGDDSAGLWVARALLKDDTLGRMTHLLVIEGGPAPENHTGKIRAFKPDAVVLVDAANLDEPPGATRWISLDEIDGMSASSHSLPLSMLGSFLNSEMGCEVLVLGIQPAQNEFDAHVSPAVQAAVDQVVMDFRKLFI
jgi:hydrogenase 3 maturation protease